MNTKGFSNELLSNTVPSKAQMDTEKYIAIEGDDDCNIRVLFIGNSITRHGPKSEIGWEGDWGMAATSPEKDYVHRVIQKLQEKYKKVGYCIAQLSEWERNFWEKEEILNRYQKARDFGADIIIVRIGENVIRDRLSQYSFEQGFDYMVGYFNRFNSAKVIVTTLFWRAEVLDIQIRNVARAKGYDLVELGDLSERDEMKALGLFNHHGVSIHPGDLGMEKIAERILNRII